MANIRRLSRYIISQALEAILEVNDGPDLTVLDVSDAVESYILKQSEHSDTESVDSGNGEQVNTYQLSPPNNVPGIERGRQQLDKKNVGRGRGNFHGCSKGEAAQQPPDIPARQDTIQNVYQTRNGTMWQKNHPTLEDANLKI